MTHAIVLAAGKGTRMRSPLAKVLHPILGEPLIAYSLRALVEAQVTDITLVVGHAAAEVEAAVRALPFLAGATLRFVMQAEQRGTGHAVQLALAQAPVAESYFIVSGDTPHIDGALLARLASERGAARLSVLVAEVHDASGLGRVVLKGSHIVRIVEERDADEATRALRVVNAGAYHVRGDFAREHIAALQPKNAQNELYLTDLVSAANGTAVAVTATEAAALGVNSQAELARSARLVRQAIIRRWHDAGVSIEDDAAIGPAVTCEAGARIERGATLLGATVIGASAVIEHHAHLDGVRVGAGARVRAFSYAENAELGVAAQLGPMARLRGAARLLDGAEVGNFCEVKASTIGKKSKSHHVSYLGDATIGEGVNIGAGTIICNYDGFNKPKSRIGDRTFIGSNSTLVAPVEIGSDAYVAAGSVITKPVADDVLALGRARQENKEGYASKLRAQLEAKKGS